jgi:hypothetical protein
MAENTLIHGRLNFDSPSTSAWIAFLAHAIASLSSNETYAEYSRIESPNERTNVGMQQLNEMYRVAHGALALALALALASVPLFTGLGIQ